AAPPPRPRGDGWPGAPARVAARPSDGADPVRRRPALPRPLAADHALQLRGELPHRVDRHAARLRRAALTSPASFPHTDAMERARRHQRALAAGAFGLLALVAELAGRSLTHRMDVGRHVAAPSYARADYYPFLI